MSRRFALISLSLLCVGGLVCWLITPASVSGSVLQEETSAAGHGHSHAEVSIPAPPPGRAEGDFDLDEPSPAEQKIQTALTNPKGVDIEYIDTPLKDALDFLADAYKLPILLDQKSLQDQGVGADATINLTLAGIKLENTLNIMLSPLSLTHIIADDVLQVTTIEKANSRRVTRVYQTGYLKQIGVEPEALARTIPALVEPGGWRTQQNQLAGEGDAGDYVSRRSRGNTGRTQSEIASSGFTVSGASLRAVQFQGAGTPNPAPMHNAIEVIGDMLVVSAPESVHGKVRGLLIQLDRRWMMEHGKK